jgi:class 3 adenylate cyclase
VTVDQVERRLAAILAADVAGYSRLMGADEEGTLKTLTLYRGVMTQLVEEHQGRVVATAGDSLLAEFSSAVQAVRSAQAGLLVGRGRQGDDVDGGGAAALGGAEGEGA